MKRALGRGLDSLIPEKTNNEVQEVKIDNIIPNKYQMRNDFNDEKINELAKSIKENSLIQPVVVTKVNRKYMIIAGERRWRAAKRAGLVSIPCIQKDMDDENFLTASLIENIQREDLSPVEEATAYDKMIKSFSMTQQEIAEKVGKSRSAVANTIRILSLPEDLRNLIIQEKITAGHARALLTIENSEKRRRLAEKIVREKLTVREAEKLASIVSGRIKIAQKKRVKKNTDSEVKKMEDKFEKVFGTKVNIKLKNKEQGVINIEFYSLKDFERIIKIICD